MTELRGLEWGPKEGGLSRYVLVMKLTEVAERLDVGVMITEVSLTASGS